MASGASDENNGKHRKIKRKAPEKCKTSCKLCEYTKFVYVIQVYDAHTWSALKPDCECIFVMVSNGENGWTHRIIQFTTGFDLQSNLIVRSSVVLTPKCMSVLESNKDLDLDLAFYRKSIWKCRGKSIKASQCAYYIAPAILFCT